MGIFSFFSRDVDEKPAAPAPVDKDEFDDDDGGYAPPARHTGTVPLPDLHKDMTIEVLDEGGRVLNTGTINEVSKTRMYLGRLPGGLSFKICEPGSTVVLRGCDSKMSQFYLRAKVEESTRIIMRLKDMEMEVHENQRDTFRLTVNAPISIYYMSDEQFSHPEQCTLVDISTGGCCIATEYLHGEGEVLRLKIKLGDYVPMDFVGEVIRVTERGPNQFHCGILFAQLTKEELDVLTKTLFNLQVGNRNERSRVHGHW